MNANPLRLVDTQTGELVHQDERDLLIEELERQKRGLTLQLAQERKKNRDLALVEPEAETILEVLNYWREKCKPRASIAIDGERWKKARARLRERLDNRAPLTPGELMLAVDGALMCKWHTHKGMGHRLDAEFLFRSYESVEKLRDLALGFRADSGLHLRDVQEVADKLRVVSWKHLTRTCECGHLRLEHAAGDPHHEGRERCFCCSCPDFFQDVFEAMGEL